MKPETPAKHEIYRCGGCGHMVLQDEAHACVPARVALALEGILAEMKARPLPLSAHWPLPSNMTHSTMPVCGCGQPNGEHAQWCFYYPRTVQVGP